MIEIGPKLTFTLLFVAVFGLLASFAWLAR
jgi:hypothetical protein